jgi:hypothetical protein
VSYKVEITIHEDGPSKRAEKAFDKIADLLYGEFSDLEIEMSVTYTSEEDEKENA